ncbi:hypothetical protein [Aquipseudomonas ullengensis]|uniref:Uncharacterized protein n=1 Tax=Aquipseudomonas ullengensis TaxID=2759166 RepID=A0A7W4LNG0_9GAMM|nr:hypothetical protein [Pseudomonas ullengensis]MBB2496295.1 hypothetical protein [Pseudomonas ullengensis]
MSQRVEVFLECCAQVLGGDETFVARLRERGFACDAGGWCFTLPALHALLMQRLDAAAQVSYARFCQELFASEINLHLRAQGAEIVIAENHGKISQSLYCLRRLPV